MYTDSHCHITCDQLYDHLDDVLEGMKDVSSCLIMCTNETEFLRALKLKEADTRFKVAFGWFPGDAKTIDDAKMERLEQYLREGKIDVLGEIGLDYYWDNTFNEVQKDLFVRQIRLANQYKVPIAIHMREATRDCLDLLKAHAKTPIVFHCFSGSVETMKECLCMNALISFAGPITFKNAKHGPDCVRACPLERLLTETDSPYLTPVPYRGKENQPGYVRFVTKKISELKGLDEADVARQIEANFLSLFQ
ncbi:TatD family hydrolase [uncultured Dubosiella sp.]|uniref:TatD family hydrolase n=1 Tax=uncultured Dubosiella sp. TaxID=1937011 RepID=UPI00272FE719|nr:TatD family hydrolase [uncultured Dubosiella sp.]